MTFHATQTKVKLIPPLVQIHIQPTSILISTRLDESVDTLLRNGCQDMGENTSERREFQTELIL